MAGPLSTVQIRPMYVLLDVSESMRTPYREGEAAPLDVFSPLLADLALDLSEIPGLHPAVWLAILAFSDEVEPLRELAPLFPRSTLGRPPKDGDQTDYARTLRYLHDHYSLDVKRIHEAVRLQGEIAGLARPLIFVITDGAPFACGRPQAAEVWRRWRQQLVEPPIEAHIAAIGLVGASEPTLWNLATGDPRQRNAFIADEGIAADALAKSVIRAIGRSISRSVRMGEMVIEVPSGMRRAHV